MAGKPLRLNGIVWMGLMFGILGGKGCVSQQDRMQRIYEPPPTRSSKKDQHEASIKRFQEPSNETSTQAEASVELAEKYAALMQETETLRANNKELLESNDNLKSKVLSLESDLKQTQAELTQANDLLMDILGELNTWKSDVLGFRNEMRQASKAELEALLKILTI